MSNTSGIRLKNRNSQVAAASNNYGSIFHSSYIPTTKTESSRQLSIRGISHRVVKKPQNSLGQSSRDIQQLTSQFQRTRLQPAHHEKTFEKKIRIINGKNQRPTRSLRLFEAGCEPVFNTLSKPRQKSPYFYTETEESQINSSYKRAINNQYFTKDTKIQSSQLIGRSSETCSICNEKIYSAEITSVEVCKHSLHTQCLLPYPQLKVKEGVTKIGCPFSECPTSMSEKFLRKVLKPKDLQQYYKFSAYSFVERMIGSNERWKACAQPNCREINKLQYLPMNVDHPQKNLLLCRTSGKKFCAECQNQYHPLFTCNQYLRRNDTKANDKKLLDVIASHGWKQCPKCKLYIEKNQGCNHIQCRCKNHFCYSCLGPYPNCYCPNAGRINELPAHFRNPGYF